MLSSGRTAVEHSRSRLAGWVAAAALLITGAHATAQGLVRVGPNDPVTGWPLFYEDSNGLKLGLCQDPTLCFFFPPDPNAPVHFPTSANDPAANYPDELFYYALDGGMTGAGTARALLRCALEAAFFNGPVAIGDNVVFARIRIRFTGLQDGATYVIRHPYGVESLVAGVDGPLPGTISMTRDIGITAPGEFTGPLAGDVGPFVTPVGFINGGPGAFIADGSTETLVQGSPVGQNFFRIDGPGAGLAFPGNAIGPNAAQLDTFVIQGQIAQSVGAGIQKAFFSRTPTQTSLNVWANAAAGVHLIASSGGASTDMVERGASGQFFARIELGAGAPRPTSVTVTNVTDFPPTSTTLSPIPDLVTVQSAVFTTGGDIVVQASSSDKVGTPQLTAIVDGAAPALLAPGAPGSGIAAGGCGLPLGAAPPPSLRVTSAAGGVVDDVIAIEGVGTPTGGGGGGGTVPVVANAGPDQSVRSGDVVLLNGLGSTGPITSYAWTHNAGATITLLGANTATPQFTAPVVLAAVDIVLTLTVSDGLAGSSADTVIVHVSPQPPQLGEIVTITDARFIASKGFWRADGTTTRLVNHTITVYLGAVGDTSRPIGNATVDILGAWAFSNPRGSATGLTIPGVGDNTVWARSSLGGDSAAFTFRRQ